MPYKPVHSHMLVALVGLISAACLSLPVRAADAACQAIIDAGHAKLRQPMVHDINIVDATSGQTSEFIKVGDDAWLKADRGWKKISPALLKTMQTAALDGLTMKECKQLGGEALGSTSTRIYSWATVVNGKSYGSARIWIGSDGLPYKLVSGNTSGTTTYTGVTAPKGAQ